MNKCSPREILLAEMRGGKSLHWDIIIVGGGITGAGALREAVRRGYRALLLEQQDFSWGTSSRSSKMVHGGLRYLAAGDAPPDIGAAPGDDPDLPPGLREALTRFGVLRG